MSVSHPRRGAVMVWFAFLLIVLLGFLGLVIDTGLLLASHRHAQNAADAAALAGAHDLLLGGSVASAIEQAKDYACEYNGIANREDVDVNIPPVLHPHRDDPNPDCAYIGLPNYVEAIVSQPTNTFFIHLVGANRTNTVTARAIAGGESHSRGEGVILLDPYAYPGLTVQGGGVLHVNGRILVNSGGEGWGLNELGRLLVEGEELPTDMDGNLDPSILNSLKVAIDTDGDGDNNLTPAVAVTDESNLRALKLDVHGGVDELTNYLPYGWPEKNYSPLHTDQPLELDPLRDLPTPTVLLGVDNTPRGEVSITNQGAGDIADNSVLLEADRIHPFMGVNFVAAGGEWISDGGNLDHTAVQGEVILYPGVYDTISISGGNVFFVPGIYIIAPKKNAPYSFSIQGGIVNAEGVMFYNTANNYTPENGLPDGRDLERRPPDKQTATEADLFDLGDYTGGFNITASTRLSPIDMTKFNYANTYDHSNPSPSDFNGMLFYQRRWNTSPILIRGNEDPEHPSSLTGTLYAKWARFDLAGQGEFKAQFVAGSMAIDGRANIVLEADGPRVDGLPKVYLVE